MWSHVNQQNKNYATAANATTTKSPPHSTSSTTLQQHPPPPLYPPTNTQALRDTQPAVLQQSIYPNPPHTASHTAQPPNPTYNEPLPLSHGTEIPSAPPLEEPEEIEAPLGYPITETPSTPASFTKQYPPPPPYDTYGVQPLTTQQNGSFTTPSSSAQPASQHAAPTQNLHASASNTEAVAIGTAINKPQQTSSSTAGTQLYQAEAGNFKDLIGRITGVPAANVTGENAPQRLVALKRKVNELQKKRESYHTRQVGNGTVGVAAAVFTGGGSLLLQGPAAIHQRNRLKQLVRAIRDCIEQINILRSSFGHLSQWTTVENQEKLNSKVFTKVIKREELKGDF